MDYCYPTEQSRLVSAAGLAPAVPWSQARDVAPTPRTEAPRWNREGTGDLFCSRAGFSLLDRCPPPGSGGPDGSKGGSGGGGRTHKGRAYEAHLNLILPAVKVVESAGNAPAWACLQGRCIACLPRPQVKSEVRKPKSETNSKLEVRITGARGSGTATGGRARLPLRVSHLGFPHSFELRNSDFGF